MRIPFTSLKLLPVIGLVSSLLSASAADSNEPEKLAGDPNHWAFKAPVRPQLPKVKNEKWLRNEIDRFVLAKLDQEGLQPSPQADRATLIRRLSLDLIGLPPTPGEVDAFVNDSSPRAYEQLVERLLSSVHYGERWGRHWLDLARYADSNGFEKDAKRWIWPYRDYVINAHNRDLPFDQFSIEQLAGDLLPNPTLEQRVATGFLRNSMMNQEGGIEPEQFRTEAMIDRIDAVGRTWLGLSIACAQCHNHKYDPISAREYYGLFAFLNNDDEPSIEVPTPEQLKQRQAILEKVREIETEALAEVDPAKFEAWEKQIGEVTSDWQTLDPKEWMNFATKFEKQSDLSLLGGGDIKPGGNMHLWIDTQLTNITGFRLEALTHPNLPYHGPGMVAKGNFLVKEFTVEVYALNNPTVTNQVKFRRALASAEAPGFSITNAIDGDTKKGGWSCEFGPIERNQSQAAVFECQEPIPSFSGGTRLHIVVYQTHSNGDGHSGAPDKESGLDSHMIGRLRVSATSHGFDKWTAFRSELQSASGSSAETKKFDGFGLEVDPLSKEQRKLLAIAKSARTPEQNLELFGAYRRSHSDFTSLNKQIIEAKKDWPYAPTTLALSERTDPRPTHLFKRGDWQRLGERVEPGVPAVLHSLPEGAPANRLGFAQWLVDRKSPTTARVIVNRIWQTYFGQGIVTTPEDFGMRVEPPSHPELLDWLACEFMDHGWSLKAMHRLITQSAVYRQSSRVTPELYERDAYNRFLARGPRFRVEAETVYDIALAASGLLNAKVGGPSVFPPIPGNVADQVYGGFSWEEAKGEDRYRRAMYTFWKRALPFPAMLAFDAPPAEGSCTRRVRSNTPLQALTTLNEKRFVEAAQALALRIVREGGPDNASRARHGFKLCTGRSPTESELNKLLKFWDEQYAYFENRTAAALSVSTPDPAKPPEDVNLHKVAAWAMVGRVLLNLDETITRE